MFRLGENAHALDPSSIGSTSLSPGSEEGWRLKLLRAVLGYAIQSAGAPSVWGGISDQPQSLFGLPAAGGFDC